MQLTSFDRWLKETYGMETHVQVLRLPEEIPRGVKVVELPDIAGQRFKFLLVVKKNKIADRLFDILKSESMMYHTQVVEKDKWYVKFVAPKERSVTWTIISWIIVGAIMVVVGTLVFRMWQNPEIRENIMEAIEILKG